MEMQPVPAPPFVEIESCPICGSPDLSPLRSRADGVAVLQCQACRMAFVQRHPADLRILYSDEYYLKPEAPGDSGYGDYDAVAAHSLGWVEQFVRLVHPAGRVLDVGCANGYLLDRLRPGFQRFGIEVNEEMARKCAAAGIEIIGRDVCDPALVASHRGRFDVITAIATLEHLVDMHGALERIKGMLSPAGVFLFEVPLLSEAHDNGIWFKSSLEHIHYPTREGLQRLLERVFGMPPIGGELHIEEYGSVYVGLAGGNAETHGRLSAFYDRVFVGPLAELRTREEKIFRFLYEVVHAARTSPELLALLPEMDPPNLQEHLVGRLAALWRRDLAACRGAQAEAEAQQRIAGERQRWIGEVEAARDYHVRQSKDWQGEAERKRAELEAERAYWREMSLRGRVRRFLGLAARS